MSTSKNPYACALCQESFSSAEILVHHVQNSHTELGPSKLKHKSVTGEYDDHDKSVKEQKQKTFHENMNEPAIIPQKLQNDSDSKKSHNSYICKECSKSYSTRSNLNNHAIIHEEKKQKCKFCPKKFYYRHSLLAHERLHTGEKPYTCKFCNKKFRISKDVIQHERCHTGEKPYACNFCDKKFAQMQNKNVHEISHTGKSFACRFCEMKYTRKQNRDEHEMKKHEMNKTRLKEL